MSRYRNITGKKVRECRNKLEFTQSELATKLQLAGLHYFDTTLVGKIESQIRSLYDYELQIFASVLKVDVAKLLPSLKHTKGEIEKLYGRDGD